jgi:hypothetical protein
VTAILWVWLVALTEPAAAQVTKTCSACGRVVAPWSHPGLTCPYCGTYWDSETWSSGGPGAFNPTAAWAMYQFLQWQHLQQQLALVHQQRLKEMQELRDQRACQRQRRRDQVRAATDRFRDQDDPLRRAKRYLAAGLQREADGAVHAARAYYRLAERLASDSSPGHIAAAALARLER